MTYEESYRKCKTLQELNEEVKEDIMKAQMLNTVYRFKNIKEAAEKVANEKFNKEETVCQGR